jgi:hypothetical protein
MIEASERVCGNCKYFNGEACLESTTVTGERDSDFHQKIKAEDSCFNGYWEEAEEKKDKLLSRDLINILKKYLDLKEEYYTLVATWIIGTYLHKDFYSYPYLFFNAMKGSGKSRALKLISHLSYKGEVVSSLNEAVLFRSEPNATFCIDEFESIASKDKQALRELLNASYKKGTTIKRMKETREMNQETGKAEKTFKVETFEPFRPICMANIFGMEEVLNDRCITLILEKSDKTHITNLLEIFDIDQEIQDIKVRLISFSVESCSVERQKTYMQMLQDWNSYIYTLLYTTTSTTTNYTNIQLFNKIKKSEISARFLELSFPLILTAEYFGQSEDLIAILKQIMEDKKEDELFESKDVQLFDFIARKEEYEGIYKSVSELTAEFRIFLGHEHDEDMKWLNSKWMGKALKRLALIGKKRRVGHGMEIMLNIEKAKKRVKLFKTAESSPEPDSNKESGYPMEEMSI